MLDSVKANYGRSASFLKSLVGRTIKLETAPAGAKSTEAPEDGLAEAVERISGAWVKGAYETLGREPITGRLLRAADDRPAPISAVFAVASATTVVTSESALGPALLQHSHDVARSTRLG